MITDLKQYFFLGATTTLRPGWETILSPVQPDKRLKDPIKISEDIATKEQNRGEKAGLLPGTARLHEVCVLNADGTTLIDEHGEAAAVKLRDFLSSYFPNGLVGEHAIQTTSRLVGLQIYELMRIFGIQCALMCRPMHKAYWASRFFEPTCMIEPYTDFFPQDVRDNMSIDALRNLFGLTTPWPGVTALERAFTARELAQRLGGLGTYGGAPQPTAQVPQPAGSA